jgi:hypothetical protein
LVDRSSGLSLLTQTISQLTAVAPVWAIAGNHDVWLGVESVCRAVVAGGGVWLADRSMTFSIGSRRVWVDAEVLKDKNNQ